MSRWLTPTENLWRRVVITPACWLWVGWVDKDGYGALSVNYKTLGRIDSRGSLRMVRSLTVCPFCIGAMFQRASIQPTCFSARKPTIEMIA